MVKPAVGQLNRPQFPEQDLEISEIDRETSSLNVDMSYDHNDSLDNPERFPRSVPGRFRSG